ncbi:MAG: hypothetical protein IIW31_01100 [Clostridia bacterium]|nr:hypothetical protein [Clostridia bacterium]
MDFNNETEFMDMMDEISGWLELPKVYLPNANRVRLLYTVCEKLQKLLDETYSCGTVFTQPCPLGSGDIIISFDASDLVVYNIPNFFEAVLHLDNFEITSNPDGTIHFAGILSGVFFVTPLPTD